MTPSQDPGSSSVTRAVETLRRVLGEIGWEPEPADGIAGFEVDFGPPHVPVATALAAISADEQFVLYLNFGFVAPPERRDEFARFIARANVALTVGAFELDYDDGQVRFKTGVDFSGVELGDALVRNAIRLAMAAVEAYADVAADVLLRGKSARAAIAEVESDPS